MCKTYLIVLSLARPHQATIIADFGIADFGDLAAVFGD